MVETGPRSAKLHPESATAPAPTNAPKFLRFSSVFLPPLVQETSEPTQYTIDMATHRQKLARDTLKRVFNHENAYPSSYKGERQREEVEKFHLLIEDAVSEGKPAQIEACRRWIDAHAIGNHLRLTAVGKFLVELANAYGFAAKPNTTSDNAVTKRPSAQRKRIHMVYIMNDLLHHAKHGLSDAVAAGYSKNYGKPFFDAFITCLRPAIVDLIKAASDCDSVKHFSHHERIRNQLTIWEVERYFDGTCDKMYKDLRVIEASEGRTVPFGAKDGRLPVSEEKNEANVKGAADLPKPEKANRWELPAVHGQPNPQFWHCQPAATMLDHVRIGDQKHRIFIRKRKFRPTKLKEGPVDPKTISMVAELIKAKKEIYNFSVTGEPGVQYDINDMGERLVVMGYKTDKNGKTVRIVKEANYYGFSVPFARKARRNRKAADEKKNMSPGSRSPDNFSVRRSSTRTPYSSSPTPAALQQAPVAKHQLPNFVPPPHGSQFPLPPPPFPPPRPQNWVGAWPPPPPNANFGAFGPQYGGGWVPPIPQAPPMGHRGGFHGAPRGGFGNRGGFRGNNRGGGGNGFRGSNRGNFRGNPY